MAKVRTTLTIDEDVLRWVKVRAARTGKGDSQVIEESLRRDLGLDLLEQLWERNQLREDEAVDLVASPLLLAELERALAYPKLRARIHESEATALIEWLGRSATIVPDPDEPTPRASQDPGDDYLLALAAHERAALVSGDRHLLELTGKLPIYAPAAFLSLLDR